MTAPRSHTPPSRPGTEDRVLGMADRKGPEVFDGWLASETGEMNGGGWSLSNAKWLVSVKRWAERHLGTVTWALSPAPRIVLRMVP